MKNKPYLFSAGYLVLMLGSSVKLIATRPIGLMATQPTQNQCAAMPQNKKSTKLLCLWMPD